MTLESRGLLRPQSFPNQFQEAKYKFKQRYVLFLFLLLFFLLPWHSQGTDDSPPLFELTLIIIFCLLWVFQLYRCALLMYSRSKIGIICNREWRWNKSCRINICSIRWCQNLNSFSVAGALTLLFVIQNYVCPSLSLYFLAQRSTKCGNI